MDGSFSLGFFGCVVRLDFGYYIGFKKNNVKITLTNGFNRSIYCQLITLELMV